MQIRLIRQLSRRADGTAPAPDELADRRVETRARSGATQPASYHLLQRTRHFAWLTLVAAILMVIAPGGQAAETAAQPFVIVTAALAIVLLAMCASYRSLATYVRAEHRHEDETANAARIDGVNLAANTLRHQIGNKLAVTVGYSEMLAEDPRLPLEVQEEANKVLRSAMAAAAVVQKLDAGVVRIELDRSVAGPKLLDIDASTDKTNAPTSSTRQRADIRPSCGAPRTE